MRRGNVYLSHVIYCLPWETLLYWSEQGDEKKQLSCKVMMLQGSMVIGWLKETMCPLGTLYHALDFYRRAEKRKINDQVDSLGHGKTAQNTSRHMSDVCFCVVVTERKKDKEMVTIYYCSKRPVARLSLQWVKVAIEKKAHHKQNLTGLDIGYALKTEPMADSHRQRRAKMSSPRALAFCAHFWIRQMGVVWVTRITETNNFLVQPNVTDNLPLWQHGPTTGQNARSEEDCELPNRWAGRGIEGGQWLCTKFFCFFMLCGTTICSLERVCVHLICELLSAIQSTEIREIMNECDPVWYFWG